MFLHSRELCSANDENVQERAKYIGLKRKFALSKDVADKVKKTTLRRSQRTLPSMVAPYGVPFLPLLLLPSVLPPLHYSEEGAKEGGAPHVGPLQELL